MRLVDKRTRLSRRDFLATGGAAALTLGTASITAPNGAWSMEVKTLKPATMRTLIQVARDIYPHEAISDQAYAKVVEPYDAAAAKDEKLKDMLEAAVVNLDVKAQAEHYVPYVQIGTRAEREALLKTVETEAFFQKIRGDLIPGLYNNKAVWTKLGYEGESVSKGGYLKRGFNDLDWV